MTQVQKTKKACKFIAGVVGLKLLLALSGCGDGTTTDPNGPPLTQAEREAKARQEIMNMPNSIMSEQAHFTAFVEGLGYTPGTLEFVNALKSFKINEFFSRVNGLRPSMNWEVTGRMAGTPCKTAVQAFALNSVRVREADDPNAWLLSSFSSKSVQATPYIVIEFTKSGREPNFQGF